MGFFSNFQSGAAVVTPVLMEPEMQLEHLDIDSYVLKDHKAFHQALVHQQTNLLELSLSGDTDGMFRDDLDILVDSLKQLKSIRRLSLLLPEVLRDEHVIAIVQDLTQLEMVYVSGLELNDVILPGIGELPCLRDITLSGISKFSFDGLFDFISQLGPGNQGIRLTIDMADPDTLLTEDNLATLKEHLAQQTGGAFDYAAYKGESRSFVFAQPSNKLIVEVQIQVSQTSRVTRTEGMV
ncbi:hypothetical protein N0V95_004475 [Ascochyta clinopodiicola]|nr:hypothetical protein N0V95_004475 [Ascochyta clinopodiicola]